MVVSSRSVTLRAVFVCLDTLGDLTLRQPLFSSALDAGLDVTVVVRTAYAPLVPRLDRRLKTLETDVDPYRVAPDARQRIEALDAAVAAASPDLLVLTAYSRTHVDEWLLRRGSAPRRAAFTHPASPVVMETLRALAPDLARASAAAPDIVVTVGESDHEIDKNRALAAALAGRAIPPVEPRLQVDEAARETARTHLRSLGLAPGRFVLGCPGGTANNACKGWPPASYASLVVHLHERHGLPVLLTGLAGESARMDDIARRAAERDVPVARHVGDADDLPLLLGLVAESRLYLGADTGPMHFAGALDVPVVALFGGGHWPRFLPRARRSFVATQELPCFRCHWDCFLAEPACLTAVATDTFVRGVDWILGDGPDERRVDRGRAVEPELAHVLRSARARHDARTAELHQLGRQLEASERRLAEFETLATRRHEDVRTLAGLLHATEEDSLQRLRNMEALEQVIAEQRRLIEQQGRTIDEQAAILARRFVRMGRKLRLA
jgi:ADP-heptose:LPS heptosyltransferase/flagellar biosynthesis chaperone FliJ